MRAPTRGHRVAARRAPVGPSRRVVLAAVSGLAVLAGSAAAGVWAWDRPARASSAGAIADGFDPRQLAVLYFEDLSRDLSLGHAADGLTEGLIKELSRARGLKVVSSRGVTPYRNAGLSRDSIARALRVGSLIEGTVEPTAKRVRVAARLVDGNSGVDVARASFELRPDQLHAGLDSLVDEMARLLRRRLGEEVRLRERRAGTASATAWTLVQRAERLRKDADSAETAGNVPGSAGALTQADSVLGRAEAADANWLEPVVARASVALRRSQLERGLDGVRWIEAGLRHVERALARAPADPEALAVRGRLRLQLWALRAIPDPASLDTLLKAARRDLEAAVQADPSLARANIALSYLYYQIEDVPGALLAARAAYEEDAYLEDADQTLHRLFWGSLDLEQLDQARRWCAEGARRFPRDFRFIQCELWLMVTPALPARADRAWTLVTRLDSLTPPAQRRFAVAQGHILAAGAIARAGLADSARSVLRRTRERITSEIDPHQDLLSNEAYVRSVMGDHDAAIDLLKRYVAANPGHDFAAQANTSWWWRELRSNARWREVVQPRR